MKFLGKRRLRIGEGDAEYEEKDNEKNKELADKVSTAIWNVIKEHGAEGTYSWMVSFVGDADDTKNCPECGSENTVHDDENGDETTCEECGHTFYDE